MAAMSSRYSSCGNHASNMRFQVSRQGTAYHGMTRLLVMLGLWVICDGWGSAVCWAVPPSIESLSPAAGQVGQEFQLRIAGSHLDLAEGVLFYDSRIQCRAFKAVSPFEAEATIFADSTVPPRSHPFRLVGRDGFSELRTVRIASLPVVAETSRESTSEPMKLNRTPVTVSGVLSAGDRDRYTVMLNKGEHLTVEVEAMRLGSLLLDTVLHIFGPDGKQRVQTDDSALFQQDPVASLIADEAGAYTIEIHESNYDGSDTSRYLLHVGSFPMVGVAYPAGAAAGDNVEVTFLRPDGSRHVQPVAVPANTNDFALFVREASLVSPSAIPFRINSLPNHLEVEPNDNTPTPSAVPRLPVAFNGVLQSHGDVDQFFFEAEGGTALLIDCFAVRIGSPADTVVSLHDAQGRLLHRNDDWSSHDSRIEFTPATTGKYRVSVTDKLGLGRPDAVYRLEITPAAPLVTPFLPRPDRLTQRGQTIHVPQGNRVLARIGVRRDLVEGVTELEWEQLPEGVSATDTKLAADQFWVPVVLEADAEAALRGTYSMLHARCQSAERGTVFGSFSQTVDLVAMSADRLFQETTVDRVAIAVTPPLPFQIEVEPPRTALPVGGTLDLSIRVIREPGFTAPIRVELPLLPPWVVAEPSLIIPGDRSEGLYRLNARFDSEPRQWLFAATARVDTVSANQDTQAWDGREVASQLVSLQVAPATIQGQVEPLAAEQGQTISVQCLLSKNGPVSARMMAELEGLPNRVVTTKREVSADDKAIEFSVQFPADAPLGNFQKLQVRLRGELDGQAVSWVVAPETTLLILPPGKLFKDEKGKPLSPLDALRRARQQPATANP